MDFFGRMKKVFGPFFRWLYRVRVTGLDNFPSEGGVIVCANHTALFDVAVLAAVVDRPFNFMAKKEIFSFKPMGRFFTKMHAFPVDRGGADVRAVKTAISLLKSGEVVNIFPQGTRRKNQDPGKTPVKNGIGMMAYHSECAILPAYIKTKKNHLMPFCKTEIIFGAPIKFEDMGFEHGGKAEYEAVTRKAFGAAVALGGYVLADESGLPSAEPKK